MQTKSTELTKLRDELMIALEALLAKEDEMIIEDRMDDFEKVRCVRQMITADIHDLGKLIKKVS